MNRRFSPEQLNAVMDGLAVKADRLQELADRVLGHQRDEEPLRHQLDGNLCPLCLELADERDAIYDGTESAYAGAAVVQRGWHRKCAIKVLTAYPTRP